MAPSRTYESTIKKVKNMHFQHVCVVAGRSWALLPVLSRKCDSCDDSRSADDKLDVRAERAGRP